ncbi:short-chain oxidoreductase [Delitschia confertaspora ATCC 74209]|uniref:Short-chain oxidoreductase n=1 Tax=Delitschia confertaspora ATCC 74209 TaxID=1513339 RepID=A0A9P4JVZ5_9PLEO|nr:short-chain oxidoreductase [Delitschia confertaspora ATCC 74209]
MPQLTWLVTGCSSGLGQTFIHGILSRGDKAIATARGDISRIAALEESGAKIYSLDVRASAADIKKTMSRIISENGEIDVLINNAGYIEAAIAEEASIDSYLDQFDINFFGVIKVTQAILPHFRERKSGSIVFLGSSGGISREPGAGPYCATKHALEEWYECLKQETAHLNIKPMIFELGFFRTNIMHPDNVKFRTKYEIADYDDIRNLVSQFVQGMNQNQPGDPKKAVEIVLDVVKGEGIAEGKAVPERLPLGADCLTTMRKEAVANLAMCNEWDGVILSTNVDFGVTVTISSV